MELTFNNGSAFFEIRSDSLSGAADKEKNLSRIISDDVINFEIVEEVGKLVSGNLSIRDDYNIYSKIITIGTKLDISFGYKNYNLSNVLFGTQIPLSKPARQGMKCLVMSPSGSGDNSGNTIFNVSFYGEDFLAKGKTYRHDSGIRSDIVARALQDMNVDDYIIDFDSGKEKVTSENPEFQKESPYNFLINLAKKWKAHFCLAYKPNGKRIAIFIDSRKIGDNKVVKFLKATVNAGSEKALYYNNLDNSNVVNYSWQRNIGESGEGDSTVVSYVNGKPVITRYVLAGEKIVAWKLNPERIKQKLNDANDKGKLALTLNSYLQAKDFESVKWAFDAIEETTAPQGMGYTVNCEMIGDPFITGLLPIVFKSGFPPCLTQSQSMTPLIRFFVRKVTHSFAKGSYSSKLEIVDSYTLNGSYISPQSLQETL